MTAPNDGGAAFPQQHRTLASGQGGVIRLKKHDLAQPGMTLRQYYKAAAIPGASAVAIEAAKNGTVWSSDQIVAFACETADALLAEDAAHKDK